MQIRPRPPASVEYHAVRFTNRLPPSAQRRLLGPPPQVDGQTLAPDLHVVLELAKAVGNDTLTGSLPPEQARAFVRRSVASTSGRPIPMAALERFEIPGAGGPLKARLYIPHGAPPPPRPLLVHYHGGGWMAGDLDTHDSPCRILASHSGAMVLSTTYRLAPEHPFPAAVEDAQAAWRWAAASAADLGADPTRMAIGGDSAGGNLASGVCIAMRDADGPRAAMQLLIYPATDAIEARPSRRLFESGFILSQSDIDHCERAYLPDKSMGYEPLASIIRAPDLSGLPPAYIATAGFDPLRDEGEEYAAKLRAAGVEVALRRHPRLIHTFANLTHVSPSSRAAMIEAAGALRMGLAYAGAPSSAA